MPFQDLTLCLLTVEVEVHTWSKLDQPKAFPRDSEEQCLSNDSILDAKLRLFADRESKKNKHGIEKGKEKRWNENPNSEVQSSWF